MDKKQESALVEETKALIEEVEGGDSEHAAWIAIHDRVCQLVEGRTQKQVGELLGKTRSWVTTVVRWSHDRDQSPFATSARPAESAAARHEAGARKVLVDPVQRMKVIAELPPETREEVLQDVWKQQDEAVEEPTPRTKRKAKTADDQTRARNQIEKALWALRARLEFYGDIPLSESEKECLPVIRTMLDRLESGAQMDDELKELIADAENAK